jgi:hypothetical protein
MAGEGFRTFVDLDILTAEQVNDYLMSQAVMVFDDATDRNTQLGVSVAEGMVSYLKDTDQLEKYTGAAWVNITADSIAKALIDAKGDLIVGTADNTPARLAVGTNEHRVVADSSTSTGLAYVADTTNFAVAAKGDLLAGTAADTLAALTVGTNGHVLTADSTAATGLAWADAGGGGLVHLASASPSTASSTSFDSVFTATYERYMITYRLAGSTSTNLGFRFRTSGTDNSASSYNEQFVGFADTTAAPSKQSTQTLTILGTLNTTLLAGQAFISGPQLAAVTLGTRTTVDTNSGYTNQRLQLQSFNFNAATQFDGFSMFPGSGTFTGVISVYGLEN